MIQIHGIAVHRPEMVAADKAPQALRGIAAVIAHFAGKNRRSVMIEMALEIISRAPKMLLGRILLPPGNIRLMGDVGRAGQIGPGQILIAKHLRQDSPGQLIACRILLHVEPAVVLIAFVVSGPQTNAGMLPQTADGDGGFLPQLFLHPGRIGVDAAGHHKILPD